MSQTIVNRILQELNALNSEVDAASDHVVALRLHGELSLIARAAEAVERHALLEADAMTWPKAAARG